MRLVPIDPITPDAAIIGDAARLLRAGGLVAFPTETVYGLGANALDPVAVDRIYAAKGRPAYNPLIVHIATRERALDVVSEWTPLAEELARVFWPGPLTMVLPKKDTVPNSVTAGLSSVAVRVPAHAVARALLAACGVPVAAPSANRSMMLSPTTGAHVAKSLGDGVDLILDAGPTSVGIESTVIDLTTPTPTLLRPGMIPVSALEAVAGAIGTAPTLAGTAARPSPGMTDRHYAPRARLVLVATHEMESAIERERDHGQRVGALVRHSPGSSRRDVRYSRMASDAAGFATQLFAALHALDDAGCDVVIAERVPDTPEWLGVRDRLDRASRR